MNDKQERSEVETTDAHLAHGAAEDKADCEHAMEQVYAFLDDELDATSAAVIRHHLAACEPCENNYDVELLVKTMIRRSCGGELAPAELRSRIVVSLTKVRHDS